MADRPRDDDWWLASDGKWYPPHLAPGADVPKPGGPGLTGSRDGTFLSTRLTNFVIGALALTSALLLVAGFFGLRVSSEVVDGTSLSTDVANASGNEVAFGGWLSFALIAFAVTAVLVIRWTYVASRVLDARGATGRRWRGGWTIACWLIPIANLVLPKLVYNELEKGFDVPMGSSFDSDPVGDRWTSRARTRLADLWWGSWVAAAVAGQVASLVGGGERASDDAIAASILFISISMVAFAVAGVCLAMVVRRLGALAKR
jgi:Domain of unknown function (DUF4328)